MAFFMHQKLPSLGCKKHQSSQAILRLLRMFYTRESHEGNEVFQCQLNFDNTMTLSSSLFAARGPQVL